MGIRFLCPNGHKLNVKSFLAGKRGICPDCDARFIIPLESGGEVLPVEEDTPMQVGTSELRSGEVPSASNLPGPATTIEQEIESWHVRTANGLQQGPFSRVQLHEMINVGQVDRDCWLWKTGWADWQRASDAFPQLIVGEMAPPAATSAVEMPQLAPASPFPDAMPHESDAASAYRRMHRQRKEKAKSLTLALIALICLLSLVLVFVLWHQG